MSQRFQSFQVLGFRSPCVFSPCANIFKVVGGFVLRMSQITYVAFFDFRVFWFQVLEARAFLAHALMFLKLLVDSCFGCRKGFRAFRFQVLEARACLAHALMCLKLLVDCFRAFEASDSRSNDRSVDRKARKKRCVCVLSIGRSIEKLVKYVVFACLRMFQSARRPKSSKSS